MARLVVAGEQQPEVAEPRGDDVEGAPVDVAGHFLLETRDADARLAHDLAAVGRDGAVEELHHRALPRPVAPQQTHALAALDGEARAVEHERPSERDPNVLHPQQSHRYRAPMAAASRASSSSSEARCAGVVRGFITVTRSTRRSPSTVVVIHPCPARL